MGEKQKRLGDETALDCGKSRQSTDLKEQVFFVCMCLCLFWFLNDFGFCFKGIFPGNLQVSLQFVPGDL